MCQEHQIYHHSLYSKLTITKAIWGEMKGCQIEATVKSVYNKVEWKINLFLVPSGKAGKGFVEELMKTLLLKMYMRNRELCLEKEQQHSNLSSGQST